MTRFEEAPMITTPLAWLSAGIACPFRIWLGWLNAGAPVASLPIRFPMMMFPVEIWPKIFTPAFPNPWDALFGLPLAEITLSWTTLPGALFRKTPTKKFGAGAMHVEVVPILLPPMLFPVAV